VAASVVAASIVGVIVLCVTAGLLESDVRVAFAKRRPTCDRFDEVGNAIPLVGRRRRSADHGDGSSLYDYVKVAGLLLCV
jgi:hypothetical protein